MLADPEDGLGIKVMFLKHSSIIQWRIFARQTSEFPQLVACSVVELVGR